MAELEIRTEHHNLNLLTMGLDYTVRCPCGWIATYEIFSAASGQTYRLAAEFRDSGDAIRVWGNHVPSGTFSFRYRKHDKGA